MSEDHHPVTRHSAWLDVDGYAASVCLHVPSDGSVRSSGAVICPPFGYEYTHSHRSLLHLADALAAEGVATLRIDYVGTGDSQGDEQTPGLPELWLKTIDVSVRTLAALTGGAPTLIGLRLGALLAAETAARSDVPRLVAWHPVVSGRRWIREQQALQGFASTESERSRWLEAGGFVLAEETAAALSSFDLRSAGIRAPSGALVLERDDLQGASVLADRLRELGIATATLTVPGYLDMMAEPQYTVVPEEAIGTIVSWIGGQDSTARAPVDRTRLEAFASRTSVGRIDGDRRVTEEHVSIPGPEGFAVRGVLTSPGGDDTPLLVLTNSGSVHRVGPHRFYVELARALAREGVATLRVDLRNLGESRLGDAPEENHPYPATALEDLALVGGWVAANAAVPLWVVGGLCSGAHAAFQAGARLDDPRLGGALCINPLTFEWTSGMSLDTPDSHRTSRDARYYALTMRSREKWVKLLKGQADLGYIVRFVLRRGVNRASVAARRVARRLGLAPASATQRALAAYGPAGRRIDFVFSTTDPGYEILLTEGRTALRRLRRSGAASVSFVQGADHTFSRRAWRAEATQAVAAAMAGRGATGGREA